MKPKLTTFAPAALAIALLGPAGPARADAVADFKTGTDVMLRIGTAGLGTATTSAGGFSIAKAPGTLDIAVDSANLGLPIGATLHLHGGATANDRIVFTVDDSFQGVTIAGHALTRVTGTLTAAVTRIPGGVTPQVGDVRLKFLSSSALVAYGDWGVQPITLTGMEFIGGIPQPGLDALVSTGDTMVCSDSVDTMATFAVWLADAAATGGAAVDFSAPHQSLRLPSQVVIAPGHRATTVTAHVKANFTGTVRVTAAAAGQTRSFDVAVHPHADCATAPATKPAVAPWVASKIAGCSNCTVFGDVNHINEQLTAINGFATVIHSGKTIELLRTFTFASAVGADTMNDDGTIAGRMTVNGVTQAYRANMNHATPSQTAVLLGQMTPRAINNYDVVVGHRVVNGLNEAVYASSSATVVPFALKTTYAVAQSRALDINDSGRVIGTYTDTSGVVRGWQWIDGRTTTLPVFGSKPALPVGINSSGQIAVNGATTAGQAIAAIISPTGGVTALGLPSGAVGFEVRSINRFGAVAGIATTSRGVTAAYAWTPSAGFIPLTNHVSGLTVTDALKITDANKVVVTGTLAGVADTYLLTL